MNLVSRFFSYLSGVWASWQEAHPSSSRIAQIFGTSAKAKSGIDVTEQTALSMTAVWSAVRFLSETQASLPLKTYKNRPGGGRDVATDHPVYHLLHSAPNPEMTAMSLRETMQAHVLLWGNAYAEIERRGDGLPLYLWPIAPDCVTPKRDDRGRLYYDVREPGEPPKTILPENMLHVAGLGYDGIKGYSVIGLHREAVGLGLAYERAGAALMGNSAVPSGILSSKGILNEQQKNDARRTWNEKHGQGAQHQGGTAVLFGDWEYKPLSMPFKDAEFIAGRAMQIDEVARIFRVAPHILYELSRSTNNNIEHQGIELVVYTLRPWCVRWEQECNRKLFSEEDRKRFYVEHLIDGLLRGDAASRSEALAKMRQNGIINGDEWREFENLNPIEDGSGKAYLVNGTMNTIEKATAAEPPPVPAIPPDDDEEEEESDEALAAAHARIAADVQGRMARRESQALQRAAASPGNFLERVETFYAEHEPFLARAVAPWFALAAALGDVRDADKYAADYCSKSKAFIIDLAGQATAKDLAARVGDYCATLEKRST